MSNRWGEKVARRLPSRPPVLPGFSYVSVLGAGGFADVFLYEQNMPRRQVAVKVLLSEVVNDQVRGMFQAEANLMAQLSAHPAVLTVYQASVSSDGRPYLVMELCSSALSARYRTDRLPVAEVLRIGIRIGSAVESAHRAGVLHRDIKPSNILLTAYGHPVLADFGIAATLGEMDQQDSVGMSIPWTAPEVLLDETPGSVRSEVWSLAATVYSLLAGRSPFEVSGGDNSSAALIGRISKAKPQPIGRRDVPPSLERLLGDALSRKRDSRPATVLDLISALQGVETELGVAQTAIEVATDDWARSTVADLEDRTVVRPVSSAASRGVPGRRRRRAPEVTSALLAPEPLSAVEARLLSGVRDRSPVSAASRSGSSRQGLRRRMPAVVWAAAASALLAIALGGIAIIVLVRATGAGIAVVSDISASVTGGTIAFSWSDPGLDAGDSYSIRTGDGDSSIQRADRFTVDAGPGERSCITVTVTRDGDAGAASGEKCMDVPG